MGERAIPTDVMEAIDMADEHEVLLISAGGVSAVVPTEREYCVRAYRQHPDGWQVQYYTDDNAVRLLARPDDEKSFIVLTE